MRLFIRLKWQHSPMKSTQQGHIPELRNGEIMLYVVRGPEEMAAMAKYKCCGQKKGFQHRGILNDGKNFLHFQLDVCVI